jgi:hypothetical protein
MHDQIIEVGGSGELLHETPCMEVVSVGHWVNPGRAGKKLVEMM